MTKLEKMQRAFESEAAKLLEQVGEPEAELLSEQVSECANGVGLLMTVDRGSERQNKKGLQREALSLLPFQEDAGRDCRPFYSVIVTLDLSPGKSEGDAITKAAGSRISAEPGTR